MSSPPGRLQVQGDSYLSDKHASDAYSGTNTEPGPVKPTDFKGKRSFLSPRVVFPVLVIVVQTALFIFAWGFFAATDRGPVPLPALIATQVNDNFQSATFVVTLFASFISLVSSFLFTRAVRYSLARFLGDSVNLFTVASTIKFSTGSLLRSTSRLEWTLLSATALVALNAQTAGWASLLMPKRITLSAPLNGFELDIMSPDFQQLMVANDGRVNPEMFTSVMPLVQMSGNTAVSTRFGLPSILNFNQLSYVNSTHGLLPPNYGEMYSTVRGATGSSLPANVRLGFLQSRPRGFPNSFMMSQQGFSANVSCTARQMNETTNPSAALFSTTETVFNSSSSVTIAQLVVRCPNANVASISDPVMTSRDVDGVFGVSCPVRDGNRQSWDLILMGTGRYNFLNTTVCNIIPYATNLTASYEDSTKFFNSSYPSFVTGSNIWGIVEAPWVGQYALSILLRSLGLSQSTNSNAMGDTISSFLAVIPEYPDALTDILEEYVRGVLEFSITLLRTAYTQDGNQLYPGNASVIPPSMRRSINGTFKAETIGWYQETESGIGGLLAPSFVMLGSIFVIVFTLVKRKGKKDPIANHRFDPGNILHVIAASSAGGLNVPFPPFDIKPYDYAQGVDITLGPVEPHGRTGFIHVKNE